MELILQNKSRFKDGNWYKTFIQMTLLEKSNIYAKGYQLYLPTKKQLEEQMNKVIK